MGENQTTLWDVFDWDTGYWDYDVRYSIGQPHQIVEINYQFDRVVLKLSSKLDSLDKRIEDIKRNADLTAKANIPTAPS
jgi:hypothetical protein